MTTGRKITWKHKIEKPFTEETQVDFTKIEIVQLMQARYHRHPRVCFVNYIHPYERLAFWRAFFLAERTNCGCWILSNAMSNNSPENGEEINKRTVSLRALEDAVRELTMNSFIQRCLFRA